MTATPVNAAAATPNPVSVAANTGNRGTLEAPLWLTAMPVAKVDYTAFTVDRAAPATAALLLKAIGSADGAARPSNAVERYEQGAAPVNPRDTVVDSVL